MLPAEAPSREPCFGGKSFEVNASMLHGHNFGKRLGITFLALLQKKSSKNTAYTHFLIFGNYKEVAGEKNYEKISAWRKIVKPCGPLAPIVIGTCAKNQVQIRPPASKNPVCLPRRKHVRCCRVGFCILAYYGGASCLPAHAPRWVRMARHGAPPRRPSKLSEACWSVFPWRCGQIDGVAFGAESWSYLARCRLVLRKSVGI